MTVTAFSAIDHAHMAAALRLAAQGLYTTQPNPRVGCVIALGSEVLGSGYHQRAGQAHAEVHALAEAGARARGATAYVTLEPCAHSGRTGPCADALLAAGIARVVVACEDPFDLVDGRGLARLRAAGVQVSLGLMRDAARELNIGFFSRIEHGRPFVRIKMACTLDGRTALADGESRWITGAAARADVQCWRARSSAILTGVGTVLQDDPRMDVRIDAAHMPPRRIILDARLRTPANARILIGAPATLIHCRRDACVAAEQALRDAGAEVLRSDAWSSTAEADGEARLNPEWLLAELARAGVNELHVESGARLAGSLLTAGLVDELLIYQNASLLGSGARPLFDLASPPTMDQRSRWQLQDGISFGNDIRLRLRPQQEDRHVHRVD